MQERPTCGGKAKGKRQEAKGKNKLPVRYTDKGSDEASHLQLLPFGFCLLPFAFVRSTQLPG
jgi:hypothetical protein